MTYVKDTLFPSVWEIRQIKVEQWAWNKTHKFRESIIFVLAMKLFSLGGEGKWGA